MSATSLSKGCGFNSLLFLEGQVEIFFLKCHALCTRAMVCTDFLFLVQRLGFFCLTVMADIGDIGHLNSTELNMSLQK